MDSKVNVKKYTGGVHTEYKIGDIVTLYDRHANGYISYNDYNKDDSYMRKYTLTKYHENYHRSVYYGIGLVAEKDFRKLSYWKIVDTTTYENKYDGLHIKYIFQLENNETSLFFRLKEKSGVYNGSFYLSATSYKDDDSCRFEIKNNMLVCNDDFLIDVTPTEKKNETKLYKIKSSFFSISINDNIKVANYNLTALKRFVVFGLLDLSYSFQVFHYILYNIQTPFEYFYIHFYHD